MIKNHSNDQEKGDNDQNLFADVLDDFLFSQKPK